MSNHIGNTNKMVDTPCTDERVVYIDGNPWVNAPFARSLERELNAAEDRIKRLQEAGDEIAYRLRLRDESDSDAYLQWIKVKEAKP